MAEALQDRVNTWDRMIASMETDEQRLTIFRQAVGDLTNNYPLHEAVDALHDMTVRRQFFGLDQDQMQAIVAAEIERAAHNDYAVPTSRALPLTFFDDLSEQPTPKPWVIKNVLARDETSSWIAPPGKGKSALLDDIGVHAAASMNWRGYHIKQRSGVVIFALERADLTRRRLIAYRRRDQLTNLPIAVAGAARARTARPSNTPNNRTIRL